MINQPSLSIGAGLSAVGTAYVVTTGATFIVLDRCVTKISLIAFKLLTGKPTTQENLQFRKNIGRIAAILLAPVAALSVANAANLLALALLLHGYLLVKGVYKTVDKSLALGITMPMVGGGYLLYRLARWLNNPANDLG